MKLRFLLAILTLLITTLPAIAQERAHITSFHVDILVHEDASLTVSETIRVYADGYDIERGIFRSQPGRYNILRIERDGEPEPYYIGKAFPGQSVYIGEEDVLLEPGYYTYLIEYEAPHEVRSFDNHDEVYWNATGTEWGFPIESATCTITLPPGINPEEVSSEGYTGYSGDQGQDYTTSIDENGQVHFETTRKLNSYEGLTVVATFPKGHVTHAPWYIRYIPSTVGSTTSRIALAVPVMVFTYFMVLWFMVGRDPRKGRILPVNHPPEDVSPAKAHYIMNMGFEKKAFTVTLISLAIKGALRIGQEAVKLGPFSSTQYTLEKTEDQPSNLTIDEVATLRTLFSSDDIVEVSQKNQSPLLQAQKALKDSLKDQCQKNYFRRNGKHLFQGIAAMYILLIWSGYLHGIEALVVVLFMSLWLSIWTIAVLGMWKGVFGSLKAAVTQRSIGQAIGGIFMLVFALPFTGANLFGFAVLAGVVSIEFALAVVLCIVIVAVFTVLLKAHTKEGRAVLDHLESFKAFLSGEHTNRFATENNLSFQEQFEQHLPYAIVLGLEQDWSRAFEAEMNQTSVSTDTDDSMRRRRSHYQPTWYSAGSNSGPGSGIDVGTFGQTLSTAFSAALSAASTSSSSSGGSSGSGGGGSSGGGGGGGGGGGW